MTSCAFCSRRWFLLWCLRKLVQFQLLLSNVFPSIVLLSSIENPDSRAGLYQVSDVIRRGQDSNLQSSGHEPDESTNSSTPLVPLIFLSLFPPGFPGFACLAGIEPALRLRLGAPVGAPLFPSPALRAWAKPPSSRPPGKRKKRRVARQSNPYERPTPTLLYFTWLSPACCYRLAALFSLRDPERQLKR